MTEQQTAGTGKISVPVKRAKTTAKVGHNKPPEQIGQTAMTEPDDAVAPGINAQADNRLRLLVERIERLNEEKKGIGDDIKDVFSEAKSAGYDVKTLRRILRLRKMNTDDRREAEALLETYAHSLGMPIQGVLL